MGIGGLLSAGSALPRRPVADRGAFVWSVLIATMATLVLAGCSANQTAGVPAPTSAGQAAAPASQPSYAGAASAAQQDYSDVAALPETVARRPVSGLNPDPSSNSNPDCATSAQQLHSLRPTLHAASEPATLWRTPGTRCERGRRAVRQSRSHQLATVPQTIADRSFLEQIAAQLESNLLSSGGLGVFERARCLHLALDAQYRAAANAALGSNL